MIHAMGIEVGLFLGYIMLQCFEEVYVLLDTTITNDY
jgi:hypothetical protein